MSETPKISLTEIAPNANSLAFLRRLVADSGGEWIGVQSNYLMNTDWELWFKNPATERSMHLMFNPSHFDGPTLLQRIRTRLETDNAEEDKKYVHVPVRVLKQLAEKLLKLSEEIDALYEEKR